MQVGVHVTRADSSEEALERLRTEKIDCVLPDQNLPGMSGLEVCTTMGKVESTIQGSNPIIMLTAKGEEDVIAGLECGADELYHQAV